MCNPGGSADPLATDFVKNASISVLNNFFLLPAMSGLSLVEVARVIYGLKKPIKNHVNCRFLNLLSLELRTQNNENNYDIHITAPYRREEAQQDCTGTINRRCRSIPLLPSEKWYNTAFRPFFTF